MPHHLDPKSRPGKTGLSASQQITLLQEGRRLQRILAVLGYSPPAKLLTYDCSQDLRSLTLSLLGFKVHAVDSDAAATDRLGSHLANKALPLSYETRALTALDTLALSDFAVAIVNGSALTELQTEAELALSCEQLSAVLKADGLLLMTSADGDRLLSSKERVSKPYIAENEDGRWVRLCVRDWRGNGYAYSETLYVIHDKGSQVTVTRSTRQCRLWRHAEILLALTQAGFTEIEQLGRESDQGMVIARQRGSKTT